MTALVRYLTHPQVEIDPAAPVPSWSLSAVGMTRIEMLTNSAIFSNTTQIICGGEKKAVETAETLRKHLDLTVEVREAMHENDRSSTGFLLPDEFEVVANRFFAEPNVCHRNLPST